MFKHARDYTFGAGQIKGKSVGGITLLLAKIGRMPHAKTPGKPGYFLRGQSL